jgi:N-acetylglucosamine-6-phosphate deacetylase
VSDTLTARGFVDLQVNGIGDVDFWTADPDGWRRAGARLLASGVTSYLPTLTTAPLGEYAPALDRVARAAADARERALPRIEGVHLEGPFLGGAPGAHPRGLIRSADVDWLVALVDRHPGLVRVVTLAPEADRGFDAVTALAARGIVVALGHSRCDYETALAAATAGARLVTHLFNGMSGLHHRNPGLAAAALDSPLLTPTIIADAVHVHPAMLRLALRTTPCILVTDAVAVGGDYFGQRVAARDGAAYLADGTLTGATVTMDVAARNVSTVLGDPVAALEAASARPAALLGLDRPGDRVVLDRESFAVREVHLDGERAWTSSAGTGSR